MGSELAEGAMATVEQIVFYGTWILTVTFTATGVSELFAACSMVTTRHDGHEVGGDPHCLFHCRPSNTDHSSCRRPFGCSARNTHW
jgi:hypothetical protein